VNSGPPQFVPDHFPSPPRFVVGGFLLLFDHPKYSLLMSLQNWVSPNAVDCSKT
jgi:hypothetical protein